MNTEAIYILKQAQEALHEANRLQQKAFDMVPESDTINTDIAYLIHNDIESCLDTIEEWVDALESSKEDV
jgi:hypothetical protein